MGNGLTFEPVRPKYLSVVLACIYTSKTPDQLEYAVRKGHLTVTIALDGSKSYAIEDLDAFMNAEKQTA